MRSVRSDGFDVVDIGTNIAGWQQFRVRGPAGTKINAELWLIYGHNSALITVRTGKAARCQDRLIGQYGSRRERTPPGTDQAGRTVHRYCCEHVRWRVRDSSLPSSLTALGQ